MIFQEPMSALDPVFTVGHQIAETLRVHTDVSKEEARERTLDMLRRVGIASPERRIDDYPHQLSGGMRQRVMIAASLICGPQLLIADEPTTALDVTVQAQILELLRDLSETSNTALMLITHDLGVVAETCTRMITMYAGEVIEDAAVDDALVRPLHPYTSGLLRSLPHLSPRHGKLPSIPGRVPSIVDMPNGCRFKARCPHAIAGCEAEQELRDAGSGRKVRCWRFNELDLPGALQHAAIGADRGHGRSSMSALAADIAQADAIVSVRDLQVQFQTSDRRATVKAVDGVDFDVRRGETFGIIGESGSGKTTIGRALVFLLKPSAGAILHNGLDPLALPRRQFQSHRRDYQIIFQDPNAALNPRMTILSSVLEPLELAREGDSAERLTRAREAMDRVGLPQDVGDRYPHQLSGGQKQRVVIARALTLRPEADRVRRGGGGAGHVDPRRRAQSVRRTAARSRAHLRLHHPRSRRGVAHQRTHRGDVSRPLRRTWPDGAGFRTAAASLYAGVAVGRAAAVAVVDAQRPPHHAAGRDPEPDRSAVGMPFPHPLPVRAGALRGADAGLARAGKGSLGRLPFRRPPELFAQLNKKSPDGG